VQQQHGVGGEEDLLPTTQSEVDAVFAKVELLTDLIVSVENDDALKGSSSETGRTPSPTNSNPFDLPDDDPRKEMLDSLILHLVATKQCIADRICETTPNIGRLLDVSDRIEEVLKIQADAQRTLREESSWKAQVPSSNINSLIANKDCLSLICLLRGPHLQQRFSAVNALSLLANQNRLANDGRTRLQAEIIQQGGLHSLQLLVTNSEMGVGSRMGDAAEDAEREGKLQLAVANAIANLIPALQTYEEVCRR